MELIGIVAAFAVLIILINRKIPLSIAMLAASLIVFLATGDGIRAIGTTTWGAIIDSDTVDLALIVGAITALAYIMNRFQFFDAMVTSLSKLLRNDRLTLVIIPGLVGCMPMVGGAIVSAPMVDKLGQRLELPRENRSAANLIFRHSWYFVFPFMPTFILASRIARIEVLDLVGIMWPLTAIMILSGYFFLFSRVPLPLSAAQTHAPPKSGDTWHHFKAFVLHALPLITGLTLFIGFNVHLALSLFIGIIIALIYVRISDASAAIDLKFLTEMITHGIDYHLVATMVAIMIFRAAVGETLAFQNLMSGMLDLGIPLYLIAAALAILIGYVSASHSSTLAVLLPVIVPIVSAAGGNILLYVALIYSLAFLSYLISPVHLCQILSNHYFDVSLGQVYRTYIPVIFTVTLATFALLAVHGLF